jgi:hypothetical protein
LSTSTALLLAAGEGIRRGGEFLQRRLDEGNETFAAVAETTGGMSKFDRRRAWFSTNREHFAEALGRILPAHRHRG